MAICPCSVLGCRVAAGEGFILLNCILFCKMLIFHLLHEMSHFGLHRIHHGVYWHGPVQAATCLAAWPLGSPPGFQWARPLSTSCWEAASLLARHVAWLLRRHALFR